MQQDAGVRIDRLADAQTEAIAAKHYLQVTQDHFTKVVQVPMQQPTVLPRTGPQATLPAQKKTPVLQGFAAGCGVCCTPVKWRIGDSNP